jgi:hypothetical protein
MKRGMALLLALLWLLTGCASVTSGTATPGGSESDGPSSAPTDQLQSSGTAGPTGFPSTTAAPPTTGPPVTSSTTVPPSTEPPTATVPPSSTSGTASPATTVVVTGSSTGRSYTLQVWAKSTITDCGAHAYGAPLVTFFRNHPCKRATRRLLTIDSAAGRTLAISTIAVECQYGGASDPYANAGRLTTLEKAQHTGSMNDLLREGVRVPGLGTSIPKNEAFAVIGQDTVVTIFDAWYTTGATTPDDPSIVRLENDLFLTPVAVPGN